MRAAISIAFPATFGSTTSCSTTVTYTSTGTKTVSLTVTDSASGTASASATVTVTNSCATDPTGDTWSPDPAGVADLVSVCAVRTPTALQVTFATSGQPLDDALATAADPVTSRILLNSATHTLPWIVVRAGGTATVVNDNALAVPSGATVSTGAGGVTVSIPLTETGTFTGVLVQTALQPDSHAQTVIEDTAPGAWLPA